tara:strand:- start:937 stop:1233 length:297 start_codon:yes stop_codon:yes gene_type:complete
VFIKVKKRIIVRKNIKMMNDKEKLKVLKHYLEETYKDSREYMDEFYENCQNGELDDLDWLVSDNQMDDFVGGSELEYVRIYDYALLELSRRLLKMIEK